MGLILFHQLRLETALAVAWNSDGQSPILPFQGLLAGAVAGIAGGVVHLAMLLMAQMVRHLGLQCAFHHSLGQLLQNAIFSEQVVGFFIAGEQRINQFIGDFIFSAIIVSPNIGVT